MRKRIISLLLAFILSAGLLSGCQKPMDAPTLVQKMEEAMRSVTAISGKIDLDLDMTMGISEMSMEMGINAEIDMKADLNTGKTFMDASMDIKMLGITQTQNMQIYIVPEGDKLVSYTYSQPDDSWSREEADTAALQSMNFSSSLVDVPAEKLVLAEEKELIGEKEYYVLTITLEGEYIHQSLEAVMPEIGSGLVDESTIAMMEDIDWSAIGATLVYHVDPETFLPAQYHIQLTGLGESLSSAISDMLAELTAGLGVDGLEITVDVPLSTISMTGISYTDVAVPDVPQEGIDAAALNPLQPDGSFVLRSGEAVVRIIPPEGYTGFAEDAQNVLIYDDDYSVIALYSLVTDMTTEQIQANYEEEITFAQELEYYESHAYGEFNGFTTLILRYTDGTAAYYAWKQLEDAQIATVEINLAAPVITPELLLNCVENYQN